MNDPGWPPARDQAIRGTALVTGVGGSLGGAIAHALAEAGADLALHCRDNHDQAGRVRKLVEDSGAKTRVYDGVDLTDRDAVRRMVDQVRQDFGGVDILVNNAGSSLVKPALAVSPDEWETVLGNNLTSAFFCSQAAAETMVQQNSGGTIVNMSSVAATRGLRNRAAYGAAKAGLIGMTRALATEWAGRGIRVNAVAAGVVATPKLTAAIDGGDASAEDALARTPLARLAEPAEIAAAVCFLASAASSYLTGQCIALDGGWSASGGEAVRWQAPRGGAEMGSEMDRAKGARK